MDNTVENIEGIVLDDAVQAPETQGESIEQLVEEPAEPQEEDPGWLKGRVNAAVQKALREQEERIRAEYDAKLAPIYESMMDRQAEELVAQGEFRSLERAKEYLQLKGGVNPVSEPEPEEAIDPGIEARADMLARQAEKIKASRGVDVMAIFNSDPDVQENILSGEWDFYDVADAMRKSPPSPIRSSNGAGVKIVDISRMSDEQFARLQKNLSKGGRYDMHK